MYKPEFYIKEGEVRLREPLPAIYDKLQGVLWSIALYEFVVDNTKDITHTISPTIDAACAIGVTGYNCADECILGDRYTLCHSFNVGLGSSRRRAQRHRAAVGIIEALSEIVLMESESRVVFAVWKGR